MPECSLPVQLLSFVQHDLPPCRWHLHLPLIQWALRNVGVTLSHVNLCTEVSRIALWRHLILFIDSLVPCCRVDV